MDSYLQNLLGSKFQSMFKARAEQPPKTSIDLLLNRNGAISIDCEWDEFDKKRLMQVGLTFLSPVDLDTFTVFFLVEEQKDFENSKLCVTDKQAALFDIAFVMPQQEILSEVQKILTEWNYGCLIGHNVKEDLLVLGLNESSVSRLLDTQMEFKRLVNPLRKPCGLRKIQGISLKRLCDGLKIKPDREFHSASNDAYMTAACAKKMNSNPALSSMMLHNFTKVPPKKEKDYA